MNINPELFCSHIVNGRPCGMMPRAHDGNALGHQFRRPDSARNVDEHSENADSGDDQESKPKRQPSVAAQLVQIALERYDLFVSEDGRPYAVERDGPNIALPLRGKAGLRARLAKIYAAESGHTRAAGQSALSDAMTVLEGYADEGERRVTPIRVAWHDGAIVVDLGTPDGRCVIVSPNGWRPESRSPVTFRRTGAMQRLPDPNRDGDGLAKLRGLLNLDDDGFRLLVGFLVAAFIPDIPHPILTFTGEQGTGKSSAAKAVINLIDPSGAPKRTAPRDVKEWSRQASASWALCLDNISTIPMWLSDALCKAVTGDGIVDRALYTDDDVIVLEFRRVIALTTIDAGALRGDLAERMLTIELQRIPDRERREEVELERAYAAAHASILASLFDLLAEVLAVRDSVTLDSKPRMADFARVLAALDRVRGWDTLGAYTAGARDVVADVIEGDPFGSALVELMRDRSEWTGTAGELLAALDALQSPDDSDIKPRSTRPKGWPTTPRAAAGALKRVAPALRAMGIDVRKGERSNRGQLYILTATTSPVSRGNEPSQPSLDAEKQALTSENSGDGWGSATVTQPSLDHHDRHAGDDCDGASDGRDLQPSQQGTLPDLHKHSASDGSDGSDGLIPLLTDDLTPDTGNPCAGGCGTLLPPGHVRCRPCYNALS